MNKLKQLRKKIGLSQADIAKELNISVKTVSRWENLETDIKPNKAEELAELLGVSVPILLGYGYKEPVKYLVWQDNIANLRKERGISQETLSKDTAIPLTLIKEWESNSGGYTAEQLERLSDYFGVSIPEIIGYSISHSELRDLINALSEESKQKLLAYAKDLKALEDFNKENNP
ncbi:helix-turn-helix domain-containing protein [Streptococcus suis]|uniref:Helix-turn-helix transcriptional regulator n=1 Tax=Streptococcus suivaginalis TaxID=3028082 RepID=A0AA97A083_9STRE|nr:helix-turn-helix transcriptional regulator [Streptococcus sp. 29896]MCK4027413.1 helix-turn-helix domain-containing protein [Streptococcus suis]WNY47119.1 helix-turn-helix transcriptional regulator [Streptococcus sp. 29896]